MQGKGKGDPKFLIQAVSFQSLNNAFQFRDK